MKNIYVNKEICTLNEEEFNRLYVAYYPLMLAYARNFVTPEDAEEAVQDVMVWLWENRETVKITTTLKGYLFRAIRNSCMTRIAQGHAQQRLQQAVFDKIQPFYEDVDRYTVEQLTKQITEALSHLPDNYRTVFERNRFEDKTYPVIASELGISVKTVEYRMSHALKQLRIELKDYLPIAALAVLLA